MGQQTITAAEYQTLLLKTKHPKKTEEEQEEDSMLVQRFNTLLLPLKWRCGEVRMLCDDARSIPPVKRQSALMNALVIWRTDTVYCAERVRFVGWLWDVVGWSDEQVSALVCEEEV